jgi:hypothetical protein
MIRNHIKTGLFTVLFVLYIASAQVLVDAVQELNAALQPTQRATLKLAAFKPVSVPV